MTTPGTETIEENQTPAVDPEAPYGRRADGTAKKGPGGRPVSTNKTGRTRVPRFGRTATSPPKTPRAKPTPPKPGTDYTESLEGASTLLGALLGMVSPVDAAAWHVATPGMVRAWNTTAQKRPEIAQLCERANLVGPYGLIFAATLPVGAQVLVNHGLIPLAWGRRFGAVAPEVVIYRFTKMVETAEAAAQETEFSDPEFQAWLAQQQQAQQPPETPEEAPAEPQPFEPVPFMAPAHVG